MEVIYADQHATNNPGRRATSGICAYLYAVRVINPDLATLIVSVCGRPHSAVAPRRVCHRAAAIPKRAHKPVGCSRGARALKGSTLDILVGACVDGISNAFVYVCVKCGYSIN